MPFASRSAPPLQPTSAALASLTLSFPDAVYPVSVCSALAAHRQPQLSSAHSSAALAPCCQLGTRRNPRFRFEHLCSCERSNLMTIL